MFCTWCLKSAERGCKPNLGKKKIIGVTANKSQEKSRNFRIGSWNQPGLHRVNYIGKIIEILCNNLQQENITIFTEMRANLKARMKTTPPAGIGFFSLYRSILKLKFILITVFFRHFLLYISLQILSIFGVWHDGKSVRKIYSKQG